MGHVLSFNIYIYCWPFKPIVGVLGFGGNPLGPLNGRAERLVPSMFLVP